MKIALLSHEGGGISSVAHGLAEGLTRKNVETTVFTTTTSNVQSAAATLGRYTVVRLPLIDHPPRSLWFHLKNSATLSRMLRDYDVIHAVSPEMAIPFVLFGKPKKPLVATAHGSHRAYLKAFVCSPCRTWTLSDFAFHVLELPLHDWTTKLCFDGSDRVVVCSYTTLMELGMCERIDVSKATVIRNGVDFRAIEKNLKEDDKKGLGTKRPTMLYAGRLFWMKGISFVLKAFEKVKMEIKDVQLRIFGRGPLENEVRKFIVSRGLQTDILFGGHIPHGELIKEIMESDVAVFPSLYESQPMFVLEAMACRKPVIAFDVPYAREIIRSGYDGILAETYNIDDLSCKVVLAFSDEELRLRIGENAYSRTRRSHDWDSQAEEYVRLYRTVADL